MTDCTNMTDIRHICVFFRLQLHFTQSSSAQIQIFDSNNCTRRSYLELKKITLYVQYNLSSILFKKTGTVSSVVDPFKSVRIRSLRKQYCFLKKNRTQLMLHVEGYFFSNSRHDLELQLLLSQSI